MRQYGMKETKEVKNQTQKKDISNLKWKFV